MKKIALFALMVILLAGCGSPGSPTLTDSEMATQVAAILTGMPTNTAAVTAPPTAKVVNNTPIPSDTPEIVVEAATEVPTVEVKTVKPTKTPKNTAVPGTPTITLTPSITPTPSDTPSSPDPAEQLGSPSGTDPMDSPAKWVWPTGNDSFTSNGFTNGYMWMTGVSNKPGWVVSGVQLTDAYIEMDARTEACSGLDAYGIIFRVPVLREADRGYLFAITCDGHYGLWKWDGKVAPHGQRTWLINWTASKYILTGANQLNRLGVTNVGNDIILYVNGYRLKEVIDKTYTQGYLGAFVDPDATSNFTYRVEEMRFWKNP
jgi:hypothetical protein